MTDEPSRLESARLILAKAPRNDDPGLSRSFHHVVWVAATTLDVARVGLWFIEDDFRRLRCALLFDRRTEQYSSGAVLDLTRYPRYADSLRQRRIIACEDAQNDPLTNELTDSYLAPAGIGAMLDSPIYDGGEVVALVCHEHVGGKRPWTKRDSDFAISVSELLSTIVAQSARLRTEAELRQAREQLSQARVMESLGRMAAETAHDFNNVLGGIALAVHALREDLPKGAPATEAAEDALALVDQGARLVKNLLTFARQGSYGGQPVDAAAHLRGMLPRIDRVLGPDVQLRAAVTTTEAPVPMDAAVLEQVLMNLVVNARDAMPGGGELFLGVEADPARVRINLRDNGVGMSEATKQRMFEPFFSTKGQRGTGLGLAIVFGAVQKAGGSIHVESAPNAGCSFTLDFPRG